MVSLDCTQADQLGALAEREVEASHFAGFVKHVTFDLGGWIPSDMVVGEQSSRMAYHREGNIFPTVRSFHVGSDRIVNLEPAAVVHELGAIGLTG